MYTKGLYFFKILDKCKLIYSGADQWPLGGGRQGGVTEGPGNWVMVVGTQVSACVTSHPFTRF